MISRPHLIYINWSSYDELSDAVELTEPLAMAQFDAMRRLRAAGVPIDAYLMDCFWHAPEGGYRTWRTPHWPQGPDAWLEACRQEGVLPGLWFGMNNLGTARMLPVPAWQDSLAEGGYACSLFEGGFWPDFLDVLAHWYARGVRVFKFDFADFRVGTPKAVRTMLAHEIYAANRAAVLSGFREFRSRCPEAILLAYNGFDEGTLQLNTFEPLRKVIDGRLLEVFDGIYCGDPRPADVPGASFWRSKDVYSDHQVWNYLHNQVPAARIDSSAFMIGTTGTCYHRGKAAWKGMLLLELIRGGWTNTLYGNLDLLDDADAAWMAMVLRTLLPLQHTGQVQYHGSERPGAGFPYAWSLSTSEGGVAALVNPGQSAAWVPLPVPASVVMVRFAEGTAPVSLGEDGCWVFPEQLVVVAWGCEAGPDWGHDATVTPVPQTVPLESAESDGRELALTFPLPASPFPSQPGLWRLRVVVRQWDRDGRPCRTTGGAPPHGHPLGDLLRIDLRDTHGTSVPFARNDDRMIWSGLSWGVVEATPTPDAPGPWTLEVYATDPAVKRLTANVLAVTDVVPSEAPQ